MRWVAAFPYRIRERRFAARAVVSGKGREKRGLSVAFGLYINFYIKKCMKILVVVHEDFPCDFNAILTCQQC